LLDEYDVVYDSSCMGDDRPYVEEHDGREILELPVHWSLDDWPSFYWGIDGGGTLARPQDVLAVWLAELDAAWAERRHITFTMHPEIIGRSYRVMLLRELPTAIRDREQLWAATSGQVADVVMAS